MDSSTHKTQVDISIIVVACSVKELIDECFTALKNANDRLNKEIIYVDNGSTDGTVQMVKEKFPETVIIESPTNLGFIRANNLGYPKANGKYVLMLNSDAFVGIDSLQESYDFMEQHPECGVLGCRLIDREGTMQPSARYFPTPWNLFLTNMGMVKNTIPFLKGVDNMEVDHSRIFECDWVIGCYLFTRKEIIDELDFFLREDFFMYFDDADLCLRIKRKNWKVFFYPNDVIHLGGINSAKLTEVTEKGKFTEKYNLESEYLYFRKNYNVFYVLADFFLIVLAAFLRVIKRVFFFKKNIVIKKTLGRVALAFNILVKTRFGKVPIH
ncbi:MAG: glycosyltransferase family 2 protein [Candidatus Parabeggiatoa sp.]|nr:glycosyltransferase family 2 protein [Candidatus Parabeggiatoa sp.]